LRRDIRPIERARITDFELIARTFDEDGYQEDGDIRIQIKATDQLDKLEHKGFISLEVEAKHYHLWIKGQIPVFLILHDAREKKAYWLYV
jgi:hypothetical protein